MFEIIRYCGDKADEWNQFVAQSKNGTFLFDRRYMDYHQDRFEDYSLMFYLDNKLYALLPANRKGDAFYSHQGLTYGGLVMNEHCRTAQICKLFEQLNEYLKDAGFQKVIYSPVPYVYHSVPSEEDLYASINICHAKLECRKISSTIDLRQSLRWHRDRRYGVNKALSHEVVIGESTEWADFWNVLSENLWRKYGVRPVHSLQEIDLLRSRFPENIRLFTASIDERILGGTVLYCTPKVIHTQYISASPEGKRLRVIDALFYYLLNRCEWNSSYFDFGISNEPRDNTLNESLIYQKEGFGGRAICYDTYEWTL